MTVLQSTKRVPLLVGQTLPTHFAPLGVFRRHKLKPKARRPTCHARGHDGPPTSTTAGILVLCASCLCAGKSAPSPLSPEAGVVNDEKTPAATQTLGGGRAVAWGERSGGRCCVRSVRVVKGSLMGSRATRPHDTETQPAWPVRAWRLRLPDPTHRNVGKDDRVATPSIGAMTRRWLSGRWEAGRRESESDLRRF